MALSGKLEGHLCAESRPKDICESSTANDHGSENGDGPQRELEAIDATLTRERGTAFSNSQRTTPEQSDEILAEPAHPNASKIVSRLSAKLVSSSSRIAV